MVAYEGLTTVDLMAEIRELLESNERLEAINADLLEALEAMMARTNGLWEKGGSAQEQKMRASVRDKARDAIARARKG